jgi:hypothetical protein
MTNASETRQPKHHRGSCHCGDVRFEVELDASTGTQCNCTICMKTALTSAIVKPDAFALLTDPEKISEYAWGHQVGKRIFCKRCGVQCYGLGHLPELGGDFVSISLNALDDVDLCDVTVTHWDGRHDNWQAGARSTRWPLHPTPAPSAELAQR